MARRVVITGMGWITPLGNDIATGWARLLKGDSGIGPVTRFDASSFSTNFAAEVKDFRLEDYLKDTSSHREAGPSMKYALGAATQAWAQSGLKDAKALRARRVGIYLGAGEGPPDYDNFMASNLAGWVDSTRTVDGTAWARTAMDRLRVEREMEQEPNMALAHLASEFNIRGPAFNCMTACAASTQAIGEATEIIRHGDAEVMVAGGCHSMIHLLGMTGFIRLTAMSSRSESPQAAARPFDQTRDGFVMGEGAAIVILEDLDHAKARGAKILAEVAGYGSSADAFRITDIQPDGKGASAAMNLALRQAGINPRETGENGRPGIHYISAHGTGTKENDKIETRAVKATFGALAPKIPFSSVKSMMGHLIQAAGAMEFITCVKAIETGFVPPTMNYSTPDPECDLDYVPNKLRDLNPVGGVEACLSNSFGFGGQNDSVIVRRFRD